MRLDSPGFTGPSTSYDHDRKDENDDHHWSSSRSKNKHSSSSSSTTTTTTTTTTATATTSPPPFFHFDPTARITFFRLRTSVDELSATSSFPFVRGTEIFQQLSPFRGGSSHHSHWPYDCYDSTDVIASSARRCSVERQDGSETRNATAFHVSYDTIYRSAQVRKLAYILEKKRRILRFRRCNGDRCARRGNDDDDDENQEGKDKNGGYGETTGTGDNPTSPSTFGESRSRSSYTRTWRPRTRWKRDNRYCGTVQEEKSASFPNARTANVPFVEAFAAYTAYNDEKDERYRDTGDSRAALPREIGNVCDCREEEGDREGGEFCPGEVRDEGNDRASRAANGVRDKGLLERFRKFRNYRCRRCPREKLHVSSGYEERYESHYYTARFQEPITNESCEDETKLSANGPTKLSNWCGRKYGLLFILYLLAWPLVCSTNPSGQFTPGFTHNPSLGLVENLSQHNITMQISSLSSSSSSSSPSSFSSSSSSSLSPSSSVMQQQQQEQGQHYRELEVEQHRETREERVEYGRDDNEHGRRRRRRGHEDRQEEEKQQQGREQREVEGSEAVVESETSHPYNEYSWEVNQINPWLSACDLAGPAPADLQGSCGPPEVPKNCPMPCRLSSKGANGNDDGDEDDTVFLEVIEKVEVTERNYYWSASEEKKPESGRLGSSSTKSAAAAAAAAAATAAAAAAAAAATAAGKNERTDRRNADGVRMAPEQCLFYLEESHKRDICRDDFGRTSTRSFLTPRENRYWFMNGLRLRHCCEHAVVNALAPGKGGPLENVLNGGPKCADALDKLLLVDALAARLHCEFEEVLARYDCAQPYSVIFNCTHCKEAYRKWVCSSLVPYFAHGGPQDLDSSDIWAGSRLRPCRSFCQSVEQRCPYLLPGDRAPAYPTQYAGEPTFLCRDPNIPETGEQAARALHSSEEEECCFRACSEERPESGICANCTTREPRKRDPPTAPHCEINSIQPVSIGAEYQQSGSTESSDMEEGKNDSDSGGSLLTSIVQQQRISSLCGSGGVGSIPSVSSSERFTPSSIPQLFWLCSILTSIFGNVRTIPSFWISKIFFWSIVPLGDAGASAAGSGIGSGGGGIGSSGGGGGVGGGDCSGGCESKPKETSQLIDVVVGWLRRCLGRVSYTIVSVRYGAKWLPKRWVVIERRWRNWWWWCCCCCWYWWWWRWRGISSISDRVRLKFRPRRKRGKSWDRGRFARTRVPPIVDPTSTTIAAAIVVAQRGNFLRTSQMFQESYDQCFAKNSFTMVTYLWYRWSCCYYWWWWLYRWWRSRKAHHGESIEDRTAPEIQNMLQDERKPGQQCRRRAKRRGSYKRGREIRQVFTENARSSPARRRYFKLFSRNDPP